MSTWTTTAKNSSTMTPDTKHSSTMTPTSKTLIGSVLLLESGFNVLLESSSKILLEITQGDPGWSTLAKS